MIALEEFKVQVQPVPEDYNYEANYKAFVKLACALRADEPNTYQGMHNLTVFSLEMISDDLVDDESASYREVFNRYGDTSDLKSD